MLIAFLRYLLGYVRFSIKGEFPERLFTQLSVKNVSVWDMRRDGKTLTACMRTTDYMNIRSLKGKNRVTTKVISRHGFPFWLKKYRYRIGFAIGFALFFITLAYLSSFVWNIEINGNQRLNTTEILSVCSELGLSEGVPIASVDQQQLPALLALKIDGIAWVSVNIEGVKVTVNIVESIQTEKQDNAPCNLVASRDGIITKIEVTNGTTVVVLGQTVQKGDLLVSGITEYKDGSSSVGSATGEIYAKTERTLTVFAPFEVTETVALGNSKKRRVLNFFGLNIPLYLGSLKGEFSVTTNTKKYCKNGMYLPVSLTTAEFTPTADVSRYREYDETLLFAENLLASAENEELQFAEIMSKDVTTEVTADGIILTANYLCRENIANKDLLLIYNGE